MSEATNIDDDGLIAGFADVAGYVPPPRTFEERLARIEDMLEALLTTRRVRATRKTRRRRSAVLH